MGVRRLSKTRLSNTRVKFDSDDDDFETPAFKSIQKDEEQNTHEHTDDESDGNSSELCEVTEGGEVKEGDVLIESEEDSDDVPEEVSFAASRDSTLAQLNRVMTQIRDAQAEKRTKRRNQDALFKQQKKKKLEKFVGQKLPDEFLDSLPSEMEKKQRKEVSKTEEPSATPDEESDANNSETELVEENEDYIPLERTGGIEVVSLKDNRLRHTSLAQSAAEFRQSRLYGKHIPRESFQHMQSRIEKRRVRRK